MLIVDVKRTGNNRFGLGAVKRKDRAGQWAGLSDYGFVGSRIAGSRVRRITGCRATGSSGFGFIGFQAGGYRVYSDCPSGYNRFSEDNVIFY
ncbi:hypothetical protein LINGRAHAP2_LOCUS19842 [Linum grandiflorum]